MKNLHAYLIDGQPVGVVVTKYREAQLNGNPPFVVSDNETLTGYQNISSIMNWWNFGFLLNLDYQCVRRATKYEFYKKAGPQLEHFNILEVEEQKLGCRLFFVPKSLRDLFYTDVEQVQHGLEFQAKSIECRTTRFLRGQALVFGSLPLHEAWSVAQDMVSPPGLSLKEGYITYGIEEKSSDGIDGLYDYVMSSPGSVYEGGGLRYKDLHPLTGTVEQLCGGVMAIIRDGIY